MLGILSVKDRMIQQAVAQVISSYFEKIFSETSYGFRSGKSMYNTLKKLKEYIEQGYECVVDLVLEQSFDRVNHDTLMARIVKVIKDKAVLKLIRAYLYSGIFIITKGN